MSRRIVIVRHGDTFEASEPPRRIGSRTDLPLVASGVAQAEALGAYFRSKGWIFDRCFISPLRRTRETAALILGDAPCTTADWLREIDHGPDENKPETAVLARIGQPALDAWDTAAIPPAGWIVETEWRRAAWGAFFTEQTTFPAGMTLVVTSNGAARLALDPSAPKLRTGSYGVIALGGDGPTLETWDVRP